MSYRRIVQSQYGKPEEVLELQTLEDPTPGTGEVVIGMEAAALHIADLYDISGTHGFRHPLPRTPSYEGVGRVVSVGDGVADFKEGDRVFPPLGSGCLSERVVAQAARVVPAPEGSAVQLALMTVNGATALTLVDDFAELRPGDWLIQNAANSNCGRYAIVLAKMRGIKTINVVRRPELIPELEALGGDEVILDGPDLAERVGDICGDARPVIGLDAVAGEATARLGDSLADGGTVVNYGAVTRENCQMSFYTMFRRDIKLCGMSMLRQLNVRSPEEQRAAYIELADLIADGKLQASIAGTFPLADYLNAIELAGKVGADRPGKVIVLPMD